MRLSEKLFLKALKASLIDKKVKWDFDIDQSIWAEMFSLAEAHHALPLIFEAVRECPAALKADPRFFAAYKGRVIRSVTMQTMKTADFLEIYRKLSECGITPLVIKGIVCRNLYPKPDYRMSTDEDLYVGVEDFPKLHELFLSWGLTMEDPKQSLEEYEISYIRPGSFTFLEVHRNLFQPDLKAYGEWNSFFTNAKDQAVSMEVDGVNIWTLSPTDHLFFLICHAFKHFLHGGFGLRQVCDMVLFANAYGCEIDWERIVLQCQEISAEVFTAALFQIGKKYFVFDEEKACYPECLKKLVVDEEELLLDLLDSGIYGSSTVNRKRSSHVTLDAVSAEKSGKKSRSAALKSLFPPVEYLESRYSYLHKRPYLLPFAWCDRIIKYRKEAKASVGSDVLETLKIGKDRVELLKKYGIIKRK